MTSPFFDDVPFDPPRRLTAHGAVYEMVFAPDDLVELNTNVPSRLREAVRQYAADHDMTMRQVVTDALTHHLTRDNDQETP